VTILTAAALIGGACAAMLALSSAPHRPRPRSSGCVARGIEAWFVQDATVPLIAMEYAFSGAPARIRRKSGVGNLVADLLDEGSGDLDSKTFHERLDRRAIELSLQRAASVSRSLRMLKTTRRSLRSAADGADLGAVRAGRCRAHPRSDLDAAP